MGEGHHWKLVYGAVDVPIRAKDGKTEGLGKYDGESVLDLLSDVKPLKSKFRLESTYQGDREWVGFVLLTSMSAQDDVITLAEIVAWAGGTANDAGRSLGPWMVASAADCQKAWANVVKIAAKHGFTYPEQGVLFIAADYD
jgi:hypothetical protein